MLLTLWIYETLSTFLHTREHCIFFVCVCACVLSIQGRIFVGQWLGISPNGKKSKNKVHVFVFLLSRYPLCSLKDVFAGIWYKHANSFGKRGKFLFQSQMDISDFIWESEKCKLLFTVLPCTKYFRSIYWTTFGLLTKILKNILIGMYNRFL